MLEVHILTERPLFVYLNSHDIPTSQKLAGGKQVTLFWGTGDMYFGNIDRNAETMTGILFQADGTVTTFAGEFIGVHGTSGDH